MSRLGRLTLVEQPSYKKTIGNPNIVDKLNVWPVKRFNPHSSQIFVN